MKTRTEKVIIPLLTLGAVLGLAMQAHSQPTNVPNTPTAPPGHVIAIYNSSGTYTNISQVNYAENWGGWYGATTYSVPPNVLFYEGVNYGGMAAFEQNPQDVAGCTNLHIDVWTPNGDSIAFRLVDTTGHSADVTFNNTSGVITDGNWIGLDMPLSQFTAANGALNLASIQQIGMIGNNPGEDPGADWYIDNIYFVGPTNLVPPPPIPTPTNAAPTPTQPAGNVLAMYDSSGVYPVQAPNDWDASWSQAAENPYTITNTSATVLKYSGLNYAGVEFYNPNQIDVTNYNTMHVDLWSPYANQFGIQLVSLDNGGTQSAQVNFTPASSNIVSNQWVSLDIPLVEFTALNASLDLSDLQQMLWIDNQGGGDVGGTFYIDNVYFYSNSVTPPPPPQPTNNAPTPTQPASGVLAMYDSSGVYPTVPVDDWLASWSASSGGSFTPTNGNPVLQYGGMNVAGVEFYSPDNIDVTDYNMMHVDIWTLNANQFGIQLVSLNPTEGAQVNFTPASGKIVTNQWISLNIPLSQFQAANPLTDLSDLQQLLWIDNQTGGGYVGGTFYIDNVYFYTAPLINITAKAVGGNIQLSFPTMSGYNYTVQYKTHLTDANWQTLTTVAGDGTTHTVTDPANQTSRFYELAIH